MQYLAEVQKVQGFVGTKSALKLLARNTNDNWQPLPNEQVINTDVPSIKEYKDGQLVLADITSGNQIQSLQDATRRIVTSLQSLSRVQDKFKVAEDEIEQWKQSLQYQAEDLHRRERELEERERELEDLYLLREQIESAQQDLLERQADLDARGKGLSTEQMEELMQICAQLEQSLNTTQGIQEALNIIYDRQNILTGFWHELEHDRNQLQAEESYVLTETSQLKLRREQWQQADLVLIDRKANLVAQEQLLAVKEQQRQQITFQLRVQEEFYQQIARIIASLGGVVEEHMLTAEETQRLESMNIDELVAEIGRLQAEFDSFARFYYAQEEELADIEGQAANLRSQIDRETDFAKKIELEAELSSLQEEYNFQEESISGQRGAFNQRQTIFNQQKAILDRRQGEASSDSVVSDLTPLLSQIDDDRKRLFQELAKLEEEINTVRLQTQQEREDFDYQTHQHNELGNLITAEEQELLNKYRRYGEAFSRVAVQQAILRPVQDIIDAIRPLLENSADGEGSLALEQLRQVLLSLND